MQHFYVLLSIVLVFDNVFMMDIYESADVYSIISVGAIYKCLKSLASVAISGAGNEKQIGIRIFSGFIVWLDFSHCLTVLTLF